MRGSGVAAQTQKFSSRYVSFPEDCSRNHLSSGLGAVACYIYRMSLLVLPCIYIKQLRETVPGTGLTIGSASKQAAERDLRPSDTTCAWILIV